jgi:hypothetical protein
MTSGPTNFNRRHPERAHGEVFLGNHDDERFAKLSFKTKRRGKVAYTKTGVAMGGVRPTFVKRDEIEKHPAAKDIVWLLHSNGVWILRYNCNIRHPELQDDEILIGNETSKGFKTLCWKTKRHGMISFTATGETMPGVRPVFVKRSELEGADNGRWLLKDLLLDGII